MFRIRNPCPNSEHPDNQKKGAKRPRKIQILGRFAPGTERQIIKCIDSEKKMEKKIFSKMLKYDMSKNRSELGTPTL